MTIREKESQLVQNILDGIEVQKNMEMLYLSLNLMFHKMIHKYGRECEREDLMQEMYFALVKAIEEYKKPEVRQKYEFSAVISCNARDRIINYLMSCYKQFTDENGKPHAYNSHNNAVSINVKTGEGDEAPETGDILPDDTDILAEIIEHETKIEQAKAAEILWEEVDKLSPAHRDAVIDYYKKGIGHIEKAEQTGEKRGTVTARVNVGIKKLRENPRVRQAAEAYLPSLAYHGGMGFFKSTGMSTTEYIALQNIEREEKQKQLEIGATSTYRIIDTTIFDGKTSNYLARMTGVAASTFNNLRKGNYGVYRQNAEKIAKFFKKPFNEIFEIHVQREVPKGNPAKGWKVPKSFILVNKDYFVGHTRADINRDKVRELNVNIVTIDNSIRRLRNGGRANTEMAKRLAFIFDEHFEDMFVPV